MGNLSAEEEDATLGKDSHIMLANVILLQGNIHDSLYTCIGGFIQRYSSGQNDGYNIVTL